jgi:hypothetical protein
MPLPQPGVDNRRAELLGDIIKNRKEQLAGELKEAGADPETLKELTTEPVQDDPKRPTDIPLEEWTGLSDEDKSNAIKAAETAAAEAAAAAAPRARPKRRRPRARQPRRRPPTKPQLQPPRAPARRSRSRSTARSRKSTRTQCCRPGSRPCRKRRPPTSASRRPRG